MSRYAILWTQASRPRINNCPGTFALNEATNLRCLHIILKIMLAKVYLFAFARLSVFSGGLYFAFVDKHTIKNPILFYK